MFKLNRCLPESVVIFGSLTICQIMPDCQTAIKLAELVLPVLESVYPNDDRPRKAIAAAKAYLANPTPENLQILTETRNATYSAAYAAYYAARYATYVDAYPAAYRAAYAARYAAYDDTYWAAHHATKALKIKQVNIPQTKTEQSFLNSGSWVNLCQSIRSN